MRPPFFLIPFFISCTFLLLAQENSQSICIGNRYSIDSEILQEKRQYSIYLPPSYGTSQAYRYPVVYLMDGYQESKAKDRAKLTYQKALDLAGKNKARQWYLNQLEYNTRKK